MPSKTITDDLKDLEAYLQKASLYVAQGILEAAHRFHGIAHSNPDPTETAETAEVASAPLAPDKQLLANLNKN